MKLSEDGKIAWNFNLIILNLLRVYGEFQFSRIGCFQKIASVTVNLKNSKIQNNVWRFIQIEALVSPKNAWLSQIFFLDSKSAC